MGKYKLAKPHNGQDEGDTIEVSDEQKQYFENVGLIKQEKAGIQTKEEKLKYNNKQQKVK